jgi:hypothetical protein
MLQKIRQRIKLFPFVIPGQAQACTGNPGSQTGCAIAGFPAFASAFAKASADKSLSRE